MSLRHGSRHRRLRRLPGAAVGAVAVVVCALLLVGGNGSLAFWRVSGTADAGSADTGHLRLVTDATNAGCGPWTFVQSPTSSGAYAGQPLQPGDTLTRTCAYTLQVTGDHLAGRISVTPGANTLPAGVTLAATGYTLDGVAQSGPPMFTSADDGQEVGVTLTLAVDPAATGSMGASAVLSGASVNATQSDPGA